jgi:RNA polymerase sigma-70 factor (ECF subfamily)
MNNPQLVKQVKAGDDSAFRELVGEYQDKVLNTCYRFVFNRNDAEEIAQDVFLEVYKSIAKFKENADLSTWIYRISVNKSIDFVRKTKRKKRLGDYNNPIDIDIVRNDSILETVDNPQSDIEQLERAKLLQWAVNSLPENQRIAIVLAKYENLSYQEVADVMKKSKSSVESVIHRGMQNLRKKLYKYYENQII